MHFLNKKVQKYLHNSKKSSNFAAHFALRARM